MRSRIESSKYFYQYSILIYIYFIIIKIFQLLLKIDQGNLYNLDQKGNLS
jgi:hypothetical protein